ncbi:MAG: restriction endonuclease subunit S [Clostridioides difficile]|nr:restriction endonuclease subunit S [Clostridioides sp.]MBS5787676.1 restriction endonuclease subunit S [Clostridioides difficile]
MEYVKIGDIYSIFKGKKVNQIYGLNDDLIRYIQIDDLRNDDNIKYCENNDKYVISKRNDIIIAWDGANAGTVNYGLEGAIGSTLALLKSKDESFSAEYVGKFLQSKFKYLRDRCTGATIPHIQKDSLIGLEIPKFEIEVQEKIAYTLDKAWELVEKRKEQIKELDELIQSVFYDMFGDLNINKKRWNTKLFDEVAVIDTKMIKDFGEYENVYHIGIENIEKNTGKIVNLSKVKDLDLKSGKYLFTEDHIIYSKIRPNLNKVALPNFTGLCSADSYPILVHKVKCNRIYFTYLLRSDYFINYILKLSSRTNIPKVNKSQLIGFKPIIPPIELQDKFADIVQNIEKQKEILQLSLKELEDNFNSLMQKAFKGELFRD